MKNLLTLILIVFSVSLFSQEATEPPFSIIENVPIYKGCGEKENNLERKKCMSAKINELIAREYDTRIASHFGLTGRLKVYVMFVIDKNGEVVEIKAKAPHPALEKEAIRVVSLIPKFDKAGHQRGKAVRVPYSLPIIFDVEETPVRKKIKSKRKDIAKLLIPDVYPIIKNNKKHLSGEELKKHTTKKIIDLIKLKFDYELADKLFPTQDSTKFKVEFIVDKKGRVRGITAKAHKKEIAIDVINVLKSFPKFHKPGYINGVAVDTPFSILMTVYFPEI